MFAEMVKNYFMRIFAFKIAKILDINQPVPNLIIGKLSGEENTEANKF